MIISFRDLFYPWKMPKKTSKKSTFSFIHCFSLNNIETITQNTFFYFIAFYSDYFISEMAQCIGPHLDFNFGFSMYIFISFRELCNISLYLFLCVCVCVYLNICKSCFFWKNFVSEMVFGVFISHGSVHARHTLYRVVLIFCFYGFIGLCSFAWCFLSNRFYFLSC